MGGWRRRGRGCDVANFVWRRGGAGLGWLSAPGAAAQLVGGEAVGRGGGGAMWGPGGVPRACGNGAGTGGGCDVAGSVWAPGWGRDGGGWTRRGAQGSYGAKGSVWGSRGGAEWSCGVHWGVVAARLVRHRKPRPRRALAQPPEAPGRPKRPAAGTARPPKAPAAGSPGRAGRRSSRWKRRAAVSAQPPGAPRRREARRRQFGSANTLRALPPRNASRAETPSSNAGSCFRACAGVSIG